MERGLKSWIFEQRLFMICSGCFLFYIVSTLIVISDENDIKMTSTLNTSLFFYGLDDLTRDAAFAVLSSDNHSRTHLESRILKFLSEESIIQRTQDCKKYFTDFITASAFSSNTVSFPLAFSHLIYHGVGVFEVFMAVAYRPQNSHCVYVDAKASEKVFDAVTSIIKCYNEIFLQNCSKCGTIIMIKNPSSVFWGHISVLEAEFVCLKYLISKNAEWKFFLNLAGSELPLVSTEKMIDMLEKSGQSIIENYLLPSNHHWRLTHSIFLKRFGFLPHEYQTKFDERKRVPPPFNLTITKGSKNVALNRTFAEFLMNDELSLELFNWMHDMVVPDESFFSTMATVIKLKNGTIIQDLERNTTHGMCIRASLWYNKEWQCAGKNINSVCNFGVEDLPKLKNIGPCMIGNKFASEVSSIAILLQRLKLIETTEQWQEQIKQII